MSTITFSNGKSVNFNGTPTPEDIDYVAKQMGIQPNQSQATTAPTAKPQGNWLTNTASAIGNFGLGIAKGASQDIAGMANTINQGIAGAISPTAPLGIGKFAQRWKANSAALNKTLTPQYNGTAQNVGGMVGGGIIDVGTLAAPTDVVGAAKDVTEAADIASKTEKIPLIGKVTGYVAQKVLNSIPEAVVGYGYGKLKGQTNQQAGITALTFGVLSGMGEAVGDTWKAFKGTLADNVQKAIGGVKGGSTSEVLAKTGKALDAFKTMANIAKDPDTAISVIGDDGVEKNWNPKKTTFGETLQALKQTKDYIYKAYTDMASKAGDEGVSFSKDDFQKVVDAVNSEAKDGTSAFKSKAASIIKDLQDNFKIVVDDSGKVTSATDTDLGRIQSYLEKVNTDVNPLSDKGGAQVSSKASQSIRESMDKKIESATGDEYQKARNGYANLKSIEKDMVNQFKKSTTQSGSKIAGYIQGYGTLDTIVSLLTGNPAEAAKGVATGVLGTIMKYLKDPENNLNSMFQQLDQNAPQSAISKRLIGAIGKTK